jgi:hypothetical protein
MRSRNCKFFVALCAACLACACGASAPSPAKSSSSSRQGLDSNTAPSGPRPTGGSSDGLTCEEVRDKNVEEVAIGAATGPDLSEKELGAVLNDGKFLAACQVPNDTKVNVCAAVKNGEVLGVTIATLPSDPDLEQCIAKQVRALSFPSNPKLDVVRTEY